MTLAAFGCSLLLVACFLSWVPGRRLWFTALGAGTLYGYLLHGFLAQGSTVTVVAAAAVTVQCTPPVRRIFRRVVEPTMEWAFRRDPRRARTGARAGNSCRVTRVVLIPTKHEESPFVRQTDGLPGAQSPTIPPQHA